MRWLSLGFDHESFWDQTSRTLALTFQAKSQQFIREHNERMSLAWHIAKLGTCDPKKFPKLKTLLHPETPAKPQQDWKQILAIAKMWTAVLGGTIVNKDRPN